MSDIEGLNESEIKILEAAEEVFYVKGKGAASMQDIADAAGITRTSLNYYYRSKDKLFEAVFKNTMGRFVPQIAVLLKEMNSFHEIIPRMVEIFIDARIANPQIPLFVLQEMTVNPKRVPEMMQELGIHPKETVRKLEEDKMLSSLGIDPRQLMMNILSLCLFPFAGRPMIQNIMFEDDKEAYLKAMEERKVLLPKMIENMIKTNMP